jgi:hypothetical protein
MRCLFQELGITTYIRGSWSRRFKHWEQMSPVGYNLSNICPECSSYSAEKLAAPNGDPENGAAQYANQDDGGMSRQGLPNVCGTDDYTTCSYGDNMVEKLLAQDCPGGLTAADFVTFADFARHCFGSSNAANEYFGSMMGYGYLLESRENPTQAVGALGMIDADWNGNSVAFYWPHNGPNMLWRKMAARILANNSRIYLNEQATCLDKATDSRASTYPYVVRTTQRNFRAKRVVFGVHPGDFTDTVKGTLGASLAATPEMQAMSDRFEGCSIEMFFPIKWWNPSRSVPTDSFCTDPACDTYTIIDTPAIRNYTEWTYYDPVAGYWFRWNPHPDIQQMNVLRVLPDYCQEPHETFRKGGIPALETRMMRYLRATFEQTGLTVPDPLKVTFSFEPYSYGYMNARSTKTPVQVLAWAKQPAGSEKICFSGEGFEYIELGWQESAAKNSDACFDTALSGLVSTSTRNKWTECRNNAGDRLAANNVPSVTNRCLRLNNEVAIASLAGVEYCPDLAVTAASVSAHDGPHAGDKGHRA